MVQGYRGNAWGHKRQGLGLGVQGYGWEGSTTELYTVVWRKSVV